MRPIEFQPHTLWTFFATHQVATMEELKRALGTSVEMTVVRKLRALGYLSSYSHRGKFYTLRELAAFDARGLLQVGAARFSRFGSLLETAAHFVAQSPAGYFTAELNPELEVETKEALLTLTRRGRVVRAEVQGRYLHCAPDAGARRSSMTPTQRSCSQMALSTLRARPCASVHPCATDSTVLRTLALRTTGADLVFMLRLALASAFASRGDRTPALIERHPPIQSP